MSDIPASVDHEIWIRRVGNDAIPPQPMPSMDVGETVRYSSDDGTVSVAFPDKSPFQETMISGAQIVMVRNIGKFRCRCFIDLKDGTERVGWQSDPSPSGADHD